MDETSKTKAIWGGLEQSILVGRGIDIGCGPDPINANARRFDIEDGDANDILDYVDDRFDFVYSSHCLEHMRDPRKALLDWWKLVKPGGHLLLIVPDEDLYEQGVFPSRFNRDHKATFTISKAKSWSPFSFNLLDLVSELPDSRLVRITLQDHGYDRSLSYRGSKATLLTRLIYKAYRKFKTIVPVRIQALEVLENHHIPIDQTMRPGVLAQIQCIVRKVSSATA
jgi:SAM-dependent methyltransferase